MISSALCFYNTKVNTGHIVTKTSVRFALWRVYSMLMPIVACILSHGGENAMWHKCKRAHLYTNILHVTACDCHLHVTMEDFKRVGVKKLIHTISQHCVRHKCLCVWVFVVE